PWIQTQPASQNMNGGESVTLSVTALGSAPIRYQWRKEGIPLPKATQATLTVSDLRAAAAGAYDVVVSNAWGQVTSTAAFISVNLAVADSFNPAIVGTISAIAIQPDGRILASGYFQDPSG